MYNHSHADLLRPFVLDAESLGKYESLYGHHRVPRVVLLMDAFR